MEDITENLEKIVGKENIYSKEPMKKHTSFKIGGKADFYIKIDDIEKLKKVLLLTKEKKVPFQIIGNGTNLLVREGGIRGIVAKLELKDYSLEKYENYAYITVGCGMTLAGLAQIALENELSGLEAIAGIPGTIGGAIRMNAGAFGTEMKDIVVSSKCMSTDGNIHELSLEEHGFSYRKSAFEKNGLILLETKVKLKTGQKDEIQKRMQECKKTRIEKQPIEFPNAGSIFKRNMDIPTAKLIEECGLKGYSIGDAEVSTKHSGFIVNKGNATADDVLELIDIIQEKVKEKFEQEIKLEVIVIGEDK